MIASVALAAAMSGCGNEHMATGLVVDVQGTLTDVDRFVVRLPDGQSLEFETSPDLLFHGGGLGHLRDHLRSGEVVTVTYRLLDGTKSAVEVTD